MIFRSWRGLLALLCVAGQASAGDAVLTREEATRLALASGAFQAQAQQVEEARGHLEQSLLRPNPTITYDRQDIFDEGVAPGFVQDLIKVEQALPSKNRRARRRTAGAREVDRARAEISVFQREKVRDVRRAFARALEAQELLVLHERARRRIETAREAISARVSAGESSSYEKTRIEIAIAQELDALAAARSDKTRLVGELALAMSVPLDSGTRLAGALPEALPRVLAGELVLAGSAAGVAGDAAAVARAVTVRPELTIPHARAAAAEAEAAALRAEARPLWTAGVGYMHFDQTGLPGQSGYNAVASVGLPVSNRNQGDIKAAVARARAARFTAQATEARIRTEVLTGLQLVRAAVARLAELKENQGGQVGHLVEMAETSYKAGLQSLLELLDAYRVERDFESAAIRARGALALAIEDLAFALGLEPALVTPEPTPVAEPPDGPSDNALEG